MDLFDGTLDAFYSWIPKTGYADPDRVFSVVENIDGSRAIRISGEHFGGLVTKDAYKNYHLVVDFRWGLVTWAPRKERARNSGILLHCQGEDGNYSPNFRSPWMRSVEYEIMEGATGDFLLVGGYDPGVPERIVPRLWVKLLPTDVWHPDAELVEFPQPVRRRLGWRHRDPRWADVLGFRGAHDLERSVGVWNQVEILARGRNLMFLLNGTVVNEGVNGSLDSGKILFQSEGAELFIRRVELRPLPE